MKDSLSTGTRPVVYARKIVIKKSYSMRCQQCSYKQQAEAGMAIGLVKAGPGKAIGLVKAGPGKAIVVKKHNIGNKIYIVTTMRVGFKYQNQNRSKDGEYHSYQKRTSKKQKRCLTILRKRTWGWFKNLKIAEKYVEKNSFDIFENEYFLAVIEEVSEGFINISNNEYWYLWENGKYVPIKKPKHFEGIVGFWS